LQLNAFEPVIAHSLFESIGILTHGAQVLAQRCVDGITINPDQLRRAVEASIGTATALNPHLGYLAATEIAVLALTSGRSVRDVALESGLITEEQLTEILSASNLAVIKVGASVAPTNGTATREPALAEPVTNSRGNQP
jgi:aspartate ammonia-lyase